MCMIELATKTMTADSTIGSQRSESGVMSRASWAKLDDSQGGYALNRAGVKGGIREGRGKNCYSPNIWGGAPGLAEVLRLLHARFARGADEGVRPYTFYGDAALPYC